MKLIYTNENRFLVSNMKNIVENAGIEVTLKNEYISGGAGELSPFDTWLELWVVEDTNQNRAIQLINDAQLTDNDHDWFCPQCHERNNAAFEICWNCQHEKGDK